MPRRAATVTQADIARAIRAMRDAGVPVERLRVVLRADGVSVEAIAEREGGGDEPAESRGERKVIVL